MLEIGTAIGYSAFCFAQGNDVHVTTIDMDTTHADIAKEMWTQRKVESLISCLVGQSGDVLPTLTDTYDIVFFDGFAPNPDEIKEYIRLLSENGVLITTNLSWNKTAPEYLATLEKFHLHTIHHDDTAFSSLNQDRITLCSELWETIAPTPRG